jgi:acetyl-CoA carboxylase biotin carboxylase subunit
MFRKVLVANRGAVAARVLRTLSEMGVGSVAIYSEADAGAPYLVRAGEAHCIGPGPARESYLNGGRIVDLARKLGVDAIHPGYGFLSENAGFARQVQVAGIAFIGPGADLIDMMGHKTRARDLMARHGMPMNVGSGVLPADTDAIAAAAERIGYPVLVKPAAGGGGIGMIAAHNRKQLATAVTQAQSMAVRGFGNGELYLERLIERPRHIEVQLLGDRRGNVRHIYERDCSVQRRHQKVIEEATAPGVARETISALADRVAATMAEIGYDNIGTVEMLMGADGAFHFLEMNTRLQVEHGVTEEVTGIDLVRAQIRAAAGDLLDDILPSRIKTVGHAIQARVYAEDPVRFFPSPGPLKTFRAPEGDGIRVETGYAEGGTVTPFYDPLLAKVIARGATREEALGRLDSALEAFAIEGLKTNIPALLKILRHEPFRAGAVHTGLLAEAQTT